VTPGLRHDGDAVPAWARVLVRLADEAIRIPGTRFQVGLDALLGLVVPGLGDAAGAITGLALIVLAAKRRVPAVVVWRMVLNVAADALAGTIPLLGDLFDVGFKANRRNLDLIERHGDPSAHPGTTDYLLASVSLLAVLVVVALPLAGLAWVASWLAGGH